MNIRWMWGNFIEPEWKLTRKQTREVHRLVHERYIPQWKMLSFTAVVIAAACGTIAGLHKPLAAWLAGLGFLRAWFVSMLVLVVPVMVGGIWCYRLLYKRPIRKAMREIGYDLCINCGYWLRGLGEDTSQCPECGAQREQLPPSKMTGESS